MARSPHTAQVSWHTGAGGSRILGTGPAGSPSPSRILGTGPELDMLGEVEPARSVTGRVQLHLSPLGHTFVQV